MERLNPSAIYIGRDGDRCDIVVDRPGVSAVHCRIRYDAEVESYVVEDLGSSNGTAVEHHIVEALRSLQSVPILLNYRILLGRCAAIRVTDELLGKLLNPESHAPPLRVPVEAVAQAVAVPEGAQVSSSFDGSGQKYIVGRDPGCEIPLSAENVSRRHLEVEPDRKERRYRVRDLESANGLSVGRPGSRVAEAIVGESDVLFLGTYRLPVVMIRETISQLVKEKSQLRLPTEGVHVIGRAGGTASLQIDAPMISREHAEVTIGPDGVWLRDLGSSNGTFVNGQRIRTRTRIGKDDETSLGSYRLHLVPGEVVRTKSYEGPVTLQADRLTFTVGDGLTILEDISLTIYPTEFVGLMGPSGAGKTTLLKAMNGYMPPSAGKVRINGQDFYDAYELYKGDIGYVPQDDIVFPQLKVFEALYYAARLRLPEDTSEQEITERIDKLLKRLEIEQTRDTRIGDALNMGISGGQRKRVNLAQELLTEPSLLYLDEPTSGLASEDTLEVMKLLRDLSNEGRTVLLTIHQPSLDAYRLMDNVICIYQGRLAYYGPTYPDSILYLNGLDSENADAAILADPGQALKPLAADRKGAMERGGLPAVVASARNRARAFAASPYHHEYVTKRAGEPLPSKGSAPVKRTNRAGLMHQLRVLTRRTALIKWRDEVNSAILLAQAPIIALVMGLVFQRPIGALAWLGSEVDPFSQLERSGAPLFLLVASAIWFGCSNAAREIVGEQVVYIRERMVNLRIDSYVGSKCAVLGSLCVVQCFTLLGVTWMMLDLPHGGYSAAGAFFRMLVTLVLCSWAGLGMGLLLSSLVRSGEAAVALVPIILIPQIVLGGILFPGFDQGLGVRALANVTVARWGFEAMMHVAHSDEATRDVANLCFSGDPDWDPEASAPVCCIFLSEDGRLDDTEAAMRRAELGVDGSFPESSLCVPDLHAAEVEDGGVPWEHYAPEAVVLNQEAGWVQATREVCMLTCYSLQEGAPLTALDRVLGPVLGPDDEASEAYDDLRRWVDSALPEDARGEVGSTIRTAPDSRTALWRLWGILGAMALLLVVAVGSVLRYKDPLPR